MTGIIADDVVPQRKSLGDGLLAVPQVLFCLFVAIEAVLATDRRLDLLDQAAAMRAYHQRPAFGYQVR